MPTQIETLLAKVNFGKLEETRHSVMIVGAFSPTTNAAGSKPFEIKIDVENRDDAYDKFIENIQPRLAEEPISTDFPGIMKLVVPTGSSDGETFVIDRSNYFFRRAASNSTHPFFEKKFKEEKEATNWLGEHRGQKFIQEIRNKLKDFCVFQHRNREILIAFMAVLSKLSRHGGLRAGILEGTLFPQGMVEELLDYFYHAADGVEEAEHSLALVDLTDITDSTDDNTTRATIRKVAVCFRSALLGRGTPGTCQVGTFSAFELSNDCLPEEIKTPFQKARKAINAIQEVLACHVLPQESIRWLLEEMFEPVTGEANPNLPAHYTKLATAMQEGWEGKSNGNIRHIIAPKNKVLSKEKREETRDNVLKNIDTIIGYLFDDSKDTEGETDEMKKTIDGVRGDKNCQALKNSFLPDGADGYQKKSMEKGARSFFRTVFLSQVAPKMFGSPDFDLTDLKIAINGYEVKAILSSLAFNANNNGNELDLTDMSEILANAISSALTENNYDDKISGICLKAAGEVAKNVAEQLGPMIQGQLELWRVAVDLLKGSLYSEQHFVSELNNTRKFPQENDVSECVDKSPVQLPKEIVKNLAIEKLDAEKEKAKVLKSTMDFKTKVEEKQVNKITIQESVQAQETDLIAANEAVATADDNTIDAAQAAVAGLQENLKKEQANLDSITESIKADEANQKNAEKILDDIFDRTNGLAETENARKLDEIFQQENLVQAPDKPLNEALLRDDLNSKIDSVVLAFMGGDAEREEMGNVLGTAEHVYHQAFETYADKMDEPGPVAISYRRTVEAMVVAKAIRAGHKRVGIAGASSGLLKAIIELVELTGVDDDSTVDAFELLKKKSLQQYIDGGLLQEGQTIAALCGQLKGAAEDSFTNIVGLVSELHGVYHLIHTAPANSRILIFNGTAADFHSKYIDSHNNSGGGPFGQLENDRPGLIYFSHLAFGSGNANLVPELSRLAETKLSANQQRFIIPPIVLSSLTVPEKNGLATDWKENVANISEALQDAPFAWIVTGPDHSLNRLTDTDFKTHLPAAYAFLEGFLVEHLDSLDVMLEGNAVIATDVSAGRLKTISGAGGGNNSVDIAVRKALTETNDGHSFEADYFLYVVLMLRLNTVSQDGEGQTLYNALRDQNNGGINDFAAIEGIKKSMFGAADAFNFGDGVGVRENSLTAGEATVGDIGWFSRALKSLDLP